ncbi:MAG: hypothetical protein JW874_03745 [Spirochaetales bacterium]|nr:hypothetical protein [Spirochaetales bacterium]
MTGVECDMCGKFIKEADRGRTYFTIGELDLCPACVREFELQVEKKVERDPYTFSAYKKALRATLAKVSK